MGENRFKRYNINYLENDNNYLNTDIDFELNFKIKFNILDRTLTADKVNIKYNSEIDKEPCIRIKTYKGTTIEGFNLKNKHLKEIKDLLENSKIKGLELLKNKL